MQIQVLVSVSALSFAILQWFASKLAPSSTMWPSWIRLKLVKNKPEQKDSVEF